MYPFVDGAQQGDTSCFIWCLLALFIVGLGFSLQQTAANPFAIALGDPETGSQRSESRRRCQLFWDHHWTYCYCLHHFWIYPLSGDELNQMIVNNEIKLTTIQYLFLGVGALFLAAAALFHFSKKLPNTKTDEVFEPANKAKNMLIAINRREFLFVLG